MKQPIFAFHYQQIPTMSLNILYPKLQQYCQALETEFALISKERQSKLLQLSHYLSQQISSQQEASIIVICTHNSRRSHLGQLWLAMGADYYQLPKVNTFSGGTEISAFNPRAVHALQEIGLEITTNNAAHSNPNYAVSWSPSQLPYQAFSKKYMDAPNPSSNFAAIMVCTEADAACPAVLGASFRLALPYIDPKRYDNSNVEALEYAKTCKIIGREMLFALKQTQQQLA